MDRMMNNMNNMMNSMMGGNMMNNHMMPSPFPMNHMNGLNNMNNMNSLMNNHMQLMGSHMNPMASNQLSLFGNPGLSNMSSFSMTSMPGQTVSYSSSRVMTSLPGSGGRPQVYEETKSSICGPNGVRETKETVKDSRTGLQQIKIGRHINDRGHLKQKKRNAYNGEEEEEDEYVNLDEEEAEEFHNEFDIKTRDYRQKYQSIASHPSHQPNRTRLALTNGSSSNQIPQQPSSSSNYNLGHNLRLEEDNRPPSRAGKSKGTTKDQKDKLKKKSKRPY